MSKVILIVDDETILRESMANLLEDEGYESLQAENGRVAHEILLEREVDVVLSDVRMPEMDGMNLLAHLKKLAPQTPIIMMTAYGTVEDAVSAIRIGAWDYLLKPVQFDDLLLKIQRAIEFSDILRDRRIMAEQLGVDSDFHHLVSESPNMLKLFELARKLSTVKSNVLIIGASGTGKELFAKAIHYNGITGAKPFVAVNCGGIPEGLIESELFGHSKGAFTGAVKDRIGFFESANGGTVFLDEISSLPMSAQSTLLRVLEERVVVPVGNTRPRPIDVRVIAASNQDLEKMVQDGKFREDLLYRLDVVKLQIPSLAARVSDIPILVHHFMEKYSAQMNKSVTGITNGAIRALLTHPWRGNIRELENVIERAIIFAEGREICLEDMPFAVDFQDDDSGEDLRDSIRQFERQHIIHCLRRHHHDKAEVAKSLGIGISSLYRKCEELGIPKNLE
ncbi:MAG: sigma-54-dependent Fis family transcriptional regulator [Phycisphaerales bacterium]|nr:sigma-54-dependent Fis family transcriptional regulator [Phycisphaerales bacterium]